MMVGALIIFFLIVEPHGLARLWQIGKQKLRVWPFPVLIVHTGTNSAGRRTTGYGDTSDGRRGSPPQPAATKGGTRCD